MNPQLDLTSPQHLRQDSVVKAWIADFQRDKWHKYDDCRRCGWPHSPVTMCGMGSVFGQVRLGGQYAYVDSGNVAHLRQFVETLSTLGFHWRNEVFIARVKGQVVISRIEYFNGHPSLKQWTIPVHEFASIVCAASEQGETSERYQQALAFLQTPAAARLLPAPATQRPEEK